MNCFYGGIKIITGSRKGSYLRVLLVIILLSTNPSRHQVVLDAVCQRKEVIPARGHITIFHQRVVQMPVECFLEIPDVLHVNNPTHRDLLPLLVIHVAGRHLSALSAYDNLTL